MSENSAFKVCAQLLLDVDRQLPVRCAGALYEGLHVLGQHLVEGFRLFSACGDGRRGHCHGCELLACRSGTQDGDQW